jgi:hypothetical protein
MPANEAAHFKGRCEKGRCEGSLDRCPKDRCGKGPYISISFRRLLNIADGMTTSVDERRSDLLCDISYLRKIDVRRSLGDAPLLPSSA